MVAFEMERPTFFRGCDLPELRLQHGAKQADIAERMGISQPSLARIESSIGWPRPPTIQRFLDALEGAVRLP